MELVTIKNQAGRKVEHFHSPKGVMSLYEIGMFWEVVRLRSENGRWNICGLSPPVYFVDRKAAIEYIEGELI